jgi:glycosyltransferase involved in cell wall biosynthesis
MMRILILTPSKFPSVTGNAITTERWRRALTDKGALVEVHSSENLDPVPFLECLQNFRPDLIHVHHAYRTATLLLDPLVLPKLSVLPLVVSPGGTDVNLDLGISERRQTTLAVLRMARVIVTQSFDTQRNLHLQMPELDSRIVNIVKSPSWFGDEPYDLRKAAGCGPQDILFFLPAGIRPVKGNLECLEAMEKVYQLRPRIRFAAAGPVIDVEYAVRFEHELSRLAAFAHWTRAIPPAAMRSAYLASDIVLNASLSEGLSNSLLEAISAGRPILASDIPGNRQPVLGEQGDIQAGWLFDPKDPEDFVKKAVG